MRRLAPDGLEAWGEVVERGTPATEHELARVFHKLGIAAGQRAALVAGTCGRSSRARPASSQWRRRVMATGAVTEMADDAVEAPRPTFKKCGHPKAAGNLKTWWKRGERREVCATCAKASQERLRRRQGMVKHDPTRWRSCDHPRVSENSTPTLPTGTRPV